MRKLAAAAAAALLIAATPNTAMAAAGEWNFHYWHHKTQPYVLAKNRTFDIVWQADGNLVQYKKTIIGTRIKGGVWSSKTAKRGLFLHAYPDCNLKIDTPHKGPQKIIWNANVPKRPGTQACRFAFSATGQFGTQAKVKGKWQPTVAFTCPISVKPVVKRTCKQAGTLPK